MQPHPDLDPELLDELRETLEDDIARLERRISRVKSDGPVALDQSAVGRLSRMDALMNQGLSQASDNRAVADCLAAHEAIARLDDGTYGYCSLCASAIPVARLEAMPETNHCAGCG